MQHFRHDGLSLAYIDQPAIGPDRGADPIVLVHGFASNHVVNWVATGWVKFLSEAGRRVIALDNRGHGESDKTYAAAAYATNVMAEDVRALMDHLGLQRADVMGYSMGARITAFLAVAHPGRVRRAVFGGLGIHLVEGVGLPTGIADAMEVASLDELTDPMQRMFRKFAEATKSDLAALAACIRGSRQTLAPGALATLPMPVLVCVGTKDPVAGDPHALAALIPHGRAFDIEGRDHNLAVGDRSYKAAVLDFLADGA